MMPDTFNSFFDTVLAKGVGVSTSLTIVICILVWYRSGSTFLLLRALLGRFMGVKSDVKSTLGRFSIEHEQLLAFRIKTGMRKVRTTSHAQRVIKWAKEHDVDIESVVACGGYFNYSKVQLNENLPPKWLLPWMKLLATLFLACAVVIVPFIVMDGALVQSSTTARWFLVWKDTFKPLTGKSASLSDCQDTEALSERLGISKGDSAGICKFIIDPKYPSFLARSVHDQHILLPIPMGMLTALFALFYRFSREIIAVFNVAGLVKARTDSATKKLRTPRIRTTSKAPEAPRPPVARRTKKTSLESDLASSSQ